MKQYVRKIALIGIILAVTGTPLLSKAEVSSISMSSVFVTDIEKAKKWYTEKLGFALVEDMVFGPGPTGRWVSLQPKGSSSFKIVFKLGNPITRQKYNLDQPEAVLTVMTKDLLKTAAELRARGVVFAMEPTHNPWAF